MKHTKETLSSIYEHQCFDTLHTGHIFAQLDVMIAIYQQFKSQKLRLQPRWGSGREISSDGSVTQQAT